MRKSFTLIIFGFICSALSAQQFSNGSTTLMSSVNLSAISALENVAESPQIRVYPNPAGDRIQISVSDKMVGSMIRIHSLLGTEVSSSNISEGQEVVDVSSLLQGFYVYNIVDKNNKTVLSGKFNKL